MYMGKWVHRLSNIDPAIKTADCLYCGPVSIHKRGRHWQCSVSKNMQRTLKRNGVLQPDGVVCELCGGDTKIAFDHSHVTNKFRGWLCMKCNTALGLVNDNVALLERMIAYLKKNAP